MPASSSASASRALAACRAPRGPHDQGAHGGTARGARDRAHPRDSPTRDARACRQSGGSDRDGRSSLVLERLPGWPTAAWRSPGRLTECLDRGSRRDRSDDARFGGEQQRHAPVFDPYRKAGFRGEDGPGAGGQRGVTHGQRAARRLACAAVSGGVVVGSISKLGPRSASTRISDAP